MIICQKKLGFFQFAPYSTLLYLPTQKGVHPGAAKNHLISSTDSKISFPFLSFLFYFVIVNTNIVAPFHYPLSNASRPVKTIIEHERKQLYFIIMYISFRFLQYYHKSQTRVVCYQQAINNFQLFQIHREINMKTFSFDHCTQTHSFASLLS